MISSQKRKKNYNRNAKPPFSFFADTFNNNSKEKKKQIKCSNLLKKLNTITQSNDNKMLNDKKKEDFIMKSSISIHPLRKFTNEHHMSKDTKAKFTFTDINKYRTKKVIYDVRPYGMVCHKRSIILFPELEKSNKVESIDTSNMFRTCETEPTNNTFNVDKRKFQPKKQKIALTRNNTYKRRSLKVQLLMKDLAKFKEEVNNKEDFERKFFETVYIRTDSNQKEKKKGRNVNQRFANKYHSYYYRENSKEIQNNSEKIYDLENKIKRECDKMIKFIQTQ